MVHHAERHRDGECDVRMDDGDVVRQEHVAPGALPSGPGVPAGQYEAGGELGAVRSLPAIRVPARARDVHRGPGGGGACRVGHRQHSGNDKQRPAADDSDAAGRPLHRFPPLRGRHPRVLGDAVPPERRQAVHALARAGDGDRREDFLLHHGWDEPEMPLQGARPLRRDKGMPRAHFIRAGQRHPHGEQGHRT